ncbi:MAG: hypothetical protein PVF06_04915, partial [Gammaproteobacteria bacterium]
AGAGSAIQGISKRILLSGTVTRKGINRKAFITTCLALGIAVIAISDRAIDTLLTDKSAVTRDGSAYFFTTDCRVVLSCRIFEQSHYDNL